LLKVTGSIGVDESIHDVTFCRGDIDPSVVDRQYLHKQLNESASPPINDGCIESSNEESSEFDEQNSE